MRFEATVSMSHPPQRAGHFLNTISTVQAGCWEIIVGAGSATVTNDGSIIGRTLWRRVALERVCKIASRQRNRRLGTIASEETKNLENHVEDRHGLLPA